MREFRNIGTGLMVMAVIFGIGPERILKDQLKKLPEFKYRG